MKDTIYRSISLIESRLADELTIDELAEQSFFSRTHYQRLFRSIVGEPVMEYIKKRRLQQAGQSLLESRESVLEIALRHGFESHEGFTRAFRAYFGMSPTRYRKDIILKEEFKMLSKELLGNITAHRSEIVKILQPIVNDFESLAKTAESTAKEAGMPGKTTLILAEEYSHLAVRISHVVKNLNEGLSGESVFAVSDSVYKFMSQIDDFAFQTNILRFLSAIETARIGEHKEMFVKIDSKVDNLMHSLMANRATVVKMLDELVKLIHTEIRKDAAGYLQNIRDLLRQTAAEGTVTAAEAKTAALSLGENGRAYMRISTELEKRVNAIKTFAETLTGETDSSAFKLVVTTAFHTNLNAFNAKVETARSGEQEALVKCTERLMAYPMVLYKAYDSCMEMWGEYLKLDELLEKHSGGVVDSPERKFEKVMEDIFFQAELLGLQLAMETERTRQDLPFGELTKQLEGALSELTNSAKDLAAFKRYHKVLTTYATKLHEEAEKAGNWGISIAAIAVEYDEFISRIGFALKEMG